MNRKRLAVIIPACNEARTIRAVVMGARKVAGTVIAVDDGSIDGTWREIGRSGALPVRHARNCGKGEAIKSGLRMVPPGTFDYVAFMDGDGQHAPGDLPRFVEVAERERAGMVIGNRFATSGRMPMVRRWVNRWVTREICQLAGCEIPDTQCGFRLIESGLIERMYYEGRRFEYETEVLVRLAQAGVRIASVPIAAYYGRERSRVRPVRDALRYWGLMHRLRKGLRGSAREWPAEAPVGVRDLV